MTQTQDQPSPEQGDVVRRPKQRLDIIKIAQVFIMVIVFVGLLTWSFTNIRRGWTNSQMAPDFSLTGFDGATITLSELRGQVVVINFWASWCLPCREEATYLEQTWRKYKDRGVIFIGVDYSDSEAPALAFLKEFGITYFNGPDLEDRISRAYNVQGIPSTFLVARDGKLGGVLLGIMQPPQLDEKIDELLKTP